jgi:predicted membrane GTPase involved in stress response
MVVVNKIDRPAACPEWVVERTFELFMDSVKPKPQTHKPSTLLCTIFAGGGCGEQD